MKKDTKFLNDNTGERNGMSKLRIVDVKGIRKVREEQKLPYAKIASMFGVSVGCVSGIIKGTRWKNIT